MCQLNWQQPTCGHLGLTEASWIAGPSDRGTPEEPSDRALKLLTGS